jgi:hypothetical protein
MHNRHARAGSTHARVDVAMVKYKALIPLFDSRSSDYFILYSFIARDTESSST